MKYIEIDNRLINLDNVNIIRKMENPFSVLIIFQDGNEELLMNHLNHKKVRDKQYNRIKSILIGDKENE